MDLLSIDNDEFEDFEKLKKNKAPRKLVKSMYQPTQIETFSPKPSSQAYFKRAIHRGNIEKSTDQDRYEQSSLDFDVDDHEADDEDESNEDIKIIQATTESLIEINTEETEKTKKDLKDPIIDYFQAIKPQVLESFNHITINDSQLKESMGRIDESVKNLQDESAKMILTISKLEHDVSSTCYSVSSTTQKLYDVQSKTSMLEKSALVLSDQIAAIEGGKSRFTNIVIQYLLKLFSLLYWFVLLFIRLFTFFRKDKKPALKLEEVEARLIQAREYVLNEDKKSQSDSSE